MQVAQALGRKLKTPGFPAPILGLAQPVAAQMMDQAGQLDNETAQPATWMVQVREVWEAHLPAEGVVIIPWIPYQVTFSAALAQVPAPVPSRSSQSVP